VTFVLLFIIGTFAVPLALEIYKHGSDNVVTRAGREVMESKVIAKAFGGVNLFGKYLSGVSASSVAVSKSIGDFAAGVITLIVLLIAAWIAVWIAWNILLLLLLLIRFLIRAIS
jgi:hypothetical protein